MVRVKGEVLGNQRPILALTVFNAAQGWFHDGHLSVGEAEKLASELLEFVQKHRLGTPEVETT